MKFYGKATETASKILEAFQAGTVPAALANVFIWWNDNSPCRKWSFSNQLLAAIAGHDDARGFRQWQEVGRNVKKGEKSFQILVPLGKKCERENKATGETESAYVTYGFKTAAVFGYEQTEGEPLPGREESREFVDSLPLIEVAREWGLHVATYGGRNGGPLGEYTGGGIALGVENLATWAHELIHAADDRIIGGLKSGQHLDQEVVAEFGGAVLLEMIGRSDSADRGGCWRYVASYAVEAKKEPLAVCQMLLERTCKAVALILQTAAEIEQRKLAAESEGEKSAAA